MALTAKQEKAVALLVDGTLKKKEIAEKLKISPQTISSWLKNPDFLRAIRDEGLKWLGEQVPVLLKNQFGLALSAKSEMVRMQATQDLLNRLGVVEDKKESEEENRADEILTAWAQVGLTTANAKMDEETSAGATPVPDKEV